MLTFQLPHQHATLGAAAGAQNVSAHEAERGVDKQPLSSAISGFVVGLLPDATTGVEPSQVPEDPAIFTAHVVRVQILLQLNAVSWPVSCSKFLF